MARPLPAPFVRPSGSRTSRFARNLILWLVPAALVWLLLTPFYNRVLIGGAEIVLHLFESPNQSHLYPRATHYLMITHGEFRGGQASAGEFRVSDSHFNWILLAALFLGTPDLLWRQRLRTLAWAAAIAVVFHLALVVFHVQFFYATQLGEWSFARYGPWARNFFGLGKHLLDLPLKFGLPQLLWAAFHLRTLLPQRAHPR
jgi:hypothetical protein